MYIDNWGGSRSHKSTRRTLSESRFQNKPRKRCFSSSSDHLCYKPLYRLNSGESEADQGKVKGTQRLCIPYLTGEICVSQTLPKVIRADDRNPSGGSNGTLAHEGNAVLGSFSQAEPTPPRLSQGESHCDLHNSINPMEKG